jgi:3-isopropylmalate/(R)-2-methylmalate dehydratase small subunit
MIVQGRVWKLGNNVDTDQLAPGRYLSLTDPKELAAHCLEGLRPEFAKEARPGDIVVAGENFGCGSSREHAPIALKALGISCLVSSSFARIFFRNCINLGLPALTSSEAAAGISDGDEVRIDLDSGQIENLTRASVFQSPPLPPFLTRIIRVGGMTEYVREQMKERHAKSKVSL